MKKLISKNFTKILLLCLVLSSALSGCGGKKGNGGISARDTTIVLATLSDIDNMNPIISSTVTASYVNGLMYPGLVKSHFDTSIGMLTFEPASALPDAGRDKRSTLATSWTFSKDHKMLTYKLRSDVKWDDGVPVTSHDFKFSYELYANPVIASVRQQYLAELVGAEKGAVDFDKAILTPNDTTLSFKFYKPVSENLALFHTGLTPVPKHRWEKVSAAEFRSSPYNSQPLGCGAYKLHKWTKQQEIVMASNANCVLPAPGNIKQIVFRVIPDYTVRLGQLQTGKVDVVENVKPEDFKNLRQANANVEIKSVGLRAFDYVGWMNIDQHEYAKTKTVKPHPLFGSKKVRQAMTHAIDRLSIIDGFLGKYGVLANTDISPTFKWAYNSKLVPHAYDPKKAAQLLDAEGWKIGADGIREKNGRKFSFTLYTNAGNNRRNYASTIIQQNLKEIGIECKLEAQESNVFFKNLRDRQYDAFLAGWSVGLEIDQLDQWGSDLEKSRFNFTGFQNPRVDELCNLAKEKLNTQDAAPEWKAYQEILHDAQPYTFLYWMKETHGFNSRIKGAEVNILSALYNIDEWELSGSAAAGKNVTK